MSPILIGYLPKRTIKRPEWLKADVEEICSASECSSSGPDGWVNQWKHNELFLFDSAEIAASIVPDADGAAYDLYAFRLYPIRFADGAWQPYVIHELQVVPLSDEDTFLGFDAVSKSCGSTFECSPLSCNN
jgi:hypothetical protein